VQPYTNSVEVHPQLNNNRHPVNGVLVSDGSLWPLSMYYGCNVSLLWFNFYLCSLPHWPKCEHIEGSTDFSFQTKFLQFVWISNSKIHSKRMKSSSIVDCFIEDLTFWQVALLSLWSFLIWCQKLYSNATWMMVERILEEK